MNRYFGLNRVLEPKGLVPVTAWRLDNDKKLQSKEARIRLELVHLEWDNFQQLCSSCGYDDIKIKAKIMDVIEKRGKLHNPFTRSAGVLIGTIDEIADDMIQENHFEVGDRVYCLSSLTGIPIYIEEITEIDYNYGQLKCKGYAILFEASPVYLLDPKVNPNYTLSAIDEAGCLYYNYQIAKKNNNKSLVIISRNTYTTLIYAAAVKEAMGEDGKVYAVMDEEAQEALTKEEIREAVYPLVEEVYFVELTEPIKSYEMLKEMNPNGKPADQVIVSEDVLGTETLAVLLVKPFGDLYFTSVENHYFEAQIVAESMSKILSAHAFDQYIDAYPDFTLGIIKKIQPMLDRINDLYEMKKKSGRLTTSRAKSILISNAGRDDDFIYQSKVTRSMIEEVLNIARYDCNVIIQGETGVGKEKVLSLIHQNSERHASPCIKINCATISENLAESEFFGYEAGAFTGAQTSGKVGYFELANGGILFLDEIGSLSMNMQSKLLRVLQENQFYRVGGTRQISVNVRVIVANNVPLKELVDQGLFREDLYYRLNICKIDVPPLRDRRDDILCLSDAFVTNWAKKYHIEKCLSAAALDQLYLYSWPGNVRELENIVHRLVISSKSVVIEGEDVEAVLSENSFGRKVASVKKSFEHGESMDFHQLMEQQEKRLIQYALEKEGTTRKAAELLGLPQTTFARKKLKYGL